MKKNNFGVAFILVGVLILTGAGCVNKNPTKNSKQTDTKPLAVVPDSITAESPDKYKNSENTCNSATEIKAPNDLAKELKLIYSEAGGEITLAANFPQDSQTGDTFVYVVKNKPTTTTLENAFKKHGYKIVMSGNILLVTKGVLNLSISMTDTGGCQQVVIMTTAEPFKLGGAVTTEECKKMLDIAHLADVRYNNMYISWSNAIKLYNYWYMLAAKYGVTREIIEKTCGTKLGI